MTMGLNAQAPFGAAPVQVAVAPEVSGPALVNAAPQAAPAPREWLVLVFINGVNDLGIMGLANNDINEMEAVGSSDRMAVMVEYGLMGSSGSDLQFQRGAKTIYVTRDADASVINSPVVYASNDADMGSEANLVRFVKRGLRMYPAKKLAVIIWNHGAGRLGISFDDTSKNHMEVDSLGRALSQISRAAGHKINVFATDACLMQLASVAYEFRNSADVIVGSEEVIPGNGYPYTPILGRLAANPGMGSEELGRIIVDEYAASYNDDATLSALRTAALPGFVGALGNWLNALKSDQASFAAATDAALVNSVSRFAYKDSKDLIDYIDKVSASPAVSQQARDAGAALKDYVARGLLIRNAAKPAFGDHYTAANGLAVYMPDLRYASDNYERMAFATDSLWDDFLLAMMSERLK
jgi:hypothetical protein